MGTAPRRRQQRDGLAGLPLAAAADTETLSGRDLPSGCPYDWVSVESQEDEHVFRVRVRSAFESWEVQVPIGPGAHDGGLEDAWIQDPGGYEDQPLAEWVACALIVAELASTDRSFDWLALTSGGGA
ncbi:hypothetical protein G9C85_02535 [Halorubellus sp. JP-L1]|uniref:hypothetical protein n=1 Tax=Halorubellus sp. JP-L1 TaxID=2715753 RepID=UPI00140B8B3F|nr:hypothetical protein [Halorubellus sp. JP-L1]NHN40515.1 hypothetical protein [Halorubellus sp. JP-L1]